MGIMQFLKKIFGGSGSGKEGTELLCADCKKTFLFEIGEQRFFQMRGLTPPKRCPSCRGRRHRRR
jgi:DNA-directed RNA polymerase subunit RPC12/RpoP